MTAVHTIYDRAAKRCLFMSKSVLIMLINKLYGREYSLDSDVEYHWIEYDYEQWDNALVLDIDIMEAANVGGDIEAI